MTDYDALRAAAEAATPGAWGQRVDDVRSIYGGNDELVVDTCGWDRDYDNAAYIAAASPDVVLGLLDELAAAEDALRARTEDVAAVLSEAFIEQGKEAIARAQDEAVTVIANRLRTQAIARFDRYGSRDVRGATLWDVSAFLTESLQELVASEAVEAAQDATTADLTAAAPHSDQPDHHDGERGGEAGERA